MLISGVPNHDHALGVASTWYAWFEATNADRVAVAVAGAVIVMVTITVMVTRASTGTATV